MAKSRNEKELSNDGSTKVMELTVGQPDGSDTKVQYRIPSNAVAFKDFVFGLSPVSDKEGEESPLELAYRRYVTGVVNGIRSEVYEAAASQSTKITSGKNKIDLMDIDLNQFVVAYNGMLGQLALRTIVPRDATEAQRDEARKAAERSIGFGAFRNAANQHVAKGRLKLDTNGVATLVESVAA